jgi:nucleotide sugar dehydrogenase
MYNITIIGFGVLGKSIGYTLCNNDIKYNYYDINESESVNLHDIIQENNKNIDSYYFLCLPTDVKEDGNLDMSSINETCILLNNTCSNRAHVILKSTVLPGTTDNLCKLYTNLHLIFSPEFLREISANEDMYNSKFILLGYTDNERNNIEMFEFFKYIFNHCQDLLILYKSNTILEIFKYTVNVFLATKVLFMNEIYLLSEKMNVNYNELQNLFILDNRLGNSHFNVPNNEKFGYGGKCFIPNTISLKYLQESLGLPTDFINAVLKRNDEIKLRND